MQFRTIYSAREESRENKKAVKFETESFTDQNFKEETDINMILAKYKVTRNPALLGLGANGEPLKKPQYGDFGDVGTYQECLEIVQEAQEQFENLPAAIRKEVGNSPESMLKWIENPDNYERGVELGIFEKLPQNLDSSNVGDINNTPSSVVDTGDVSTKVTPQE